MLVVGHVRWWQEVTAGGGSSIGSSSGAVYKQTRHHLMVSITQERAWLQRQQEALLSVAVFQGHWEPWKVAELPFGSRSCQTTWMAGAGHL